MVDANPVAVDGRIAAVAQADSAAALIGAVRSLAAAQSPEAIPTLIQVLGFNNPGAAVAAVDGLVALGKHAVPDLLVQLDGYNYGARAWAIRALAMIGDPRALNILVETARGDFALSVRRAAAKGLGFIRWAELPAEARAGSQSLAREALLTALGDPEWVVRYAAIAGLSGLITALEVDCEAVERIRGRLLRVAQEDEEAVIRARARWVLTQGKPHSKVP